MVEEGSDRCCGLDMDAQPNCCRNPPLFAYLVSKRKNRSDSQSLFNSLSLSRRRLLLVDVDMDG
jgi:hypothetical protein